MRGDTYARSSGADRSATHNRVRRWRSRVCSAMSAPAGSTSRRMSSMLSIEGSCCLLYSGKRGELVGGGCGCGGFVRRV